MIAFDRAEELTALSKKVHAMLRAPLVVDAILHDTQALGFGMASEPQVGMLLRCLAASKPGGRFLELGTGTGLATAWLLAGMDRDATLDTVDNDEAVQAVARRHLARDPRVSFHLEDGGEFLRKRNSQQYDLIFADAWPGKFYDLEAALAPLAPGGLYVIDDLSPQASWPDGHAEKVPPLIACLEANEQLCCLQLAWSTGLMIAVKRPNQGHAASTFAGG